MNIVSEKEAIVKRIQEVEDIDVLDAVKDLLDFAATKNNAMLEAALDRSIKQSDDRNVRQHEVVWQEIRSRYK